MKPEDPVTFPPQGAEQGRGKERRDEWHHTHAAFSEVTNLQQISWDELHSRKSASLNITEMDSITSVGNCSDIRTPKI